MRPIHPMRSIQLCFIGESFVNGTGDRTHLGWTGRVCVDLSQRGYDVTYYNLGIRGETSTDLLQRWQPEVERRVRSNADNRLVFCFGVNDTTLKQGKQRVALGDSLKQAHQILSVAQARYPVLMVGPAAIADADQNSRIQTLSDQMTHLCSELMVPYLDVVRLLSQSEVWQAEVLAGDGAHPDAAGYAELAAIVQAWPAWKQWFTA